MGVVSRVVRGGFHGSKRSKGIRTQREKTLPASVFAYLATLKAPLIIRLNGLVSRFTIIETSFNITRCNADFEAVESNIVSPRVSGCAILIFNITKTA